MTQEQLARRLRRLLQTAQRDSHDYTRTLDNLQKLPLSADQYSVAVQILDSVLDCQTTPEKGTAQILRAGEPAKS